MKKSKKLIIIILSFSFLGIACGLIKNKIVLNSSNVENLPVIEATAMYLYDTSIPEKSIGVSDYVFVAKINRILRTEHLHQIEVENGLFDKTTISDPYTIYEIEVIENIKGQLITTEPIEYMQYGGLNEDKKSYTFLEGGSLLNEGEYYILLVDTWEETDGETIEIGDPNRIIPLGDDLSSATAISQISKYKKSYEEEITYPQKVNHISKYDINYSN